jgi:two-component system, NtrC family, C4-dicarboxylate transport response regulator DctD
MHLANPNGALPSVRYKVLLVDDDPALLRSLAAVLELEHDLEISCCDSAERALTLLAAGGFHVVCTDYAMLGMTGLELLKQAAQLPECVGCLLLTGSNLFLGRHAEGAGDHYVLMKPVDPARLSSLILQLARTAEMKRGTNRVRNLMHAAQRRSG